MTRRRRVLVPIAVDEYFLHAIAHHYGKKRATTSDVRAWAAMLIKATREVLEAELDQAVEDSDVDENNNDTD